MAQIQQQNIQFANPDTRQAYNNILGSYRDYINDIIIRDRENKTIFEQTQAAIDSISIGNGSENDKAIFSQISQEMGQEINKIANAATGDNGYADLNIQVNELKRKYLNHKGIKALQQSTMHAQSLLAEANGEIEEDIIGLDGKPTKQKKQKYGYLTQDMRQFALNEAMSESGVQYNAETGEYKFIGKSLNIPENYDEEKVREEFAKKALKFEQDDITFNKTTGKFERLNVKTQGISGDKFYNIRLKESGIKVDNLNRALELEISRDHKAREYAEFMARYTNKNNFDINARIANEENNIRNYIDSHFADENTFNNYKLELEKNKYDITTGYIANENTNSKNIIDGVAMFNKIYNIKSGDSLNIIKDKVSKKHTIENISFYRQKLQEFKTRTGITNVTGEIAKQLDKDIQTNIFLNGMIERGKTKNILLLPTSITANTDIIDIGDEKKRKEEKESLAKETMLGWGSLSAGAASYTIEDLNKIDNNLDELDNELIIKLKTYYTSKGLSPNGIDKTNVRKLAATLSNVKDAYDIKNSLDKIANISYKRNTIDLEFQNIKNMFNDISDQDIYNSQVVSVKGFFDSLASMIPDEHDPNYNKYVGEKGIFGTYYNTEVIGQLLVDARNKDKNTFIKDLTNKGVKLDDAKKIYNKSINHLVELAEEKNLTFNSESAITVESTDQKEQSDYAYKAFDYIKGIKGATVSGKEFKGILTTNSEKWQDIINDSRFKEGPNKGEINPNKLKIIPIINAKGKPQAEVHITDNNGNIKSFVMTYNSDLTYMQEYSFKKLANELKDNNRIMSPKQIQQNTNSLYGGIASYMNITLDEKETKISGGKAQIKLEELAGHAINLKPGENIIFKSETGILYKATKMKPSQEHNEGSISIEVLDRNNNIQGNISGVNTSFGNWQDCMSNIALYESNYINSSTGTDYNSNLLMVNKIFKGN